jgi:hypothetical protein
MMAAFTGIPLEVREKLGQRATNGTTLRPADVQPLIDQAAKYKIIPNALRPKSSSSPRP